MTVYSSSAKHFTDHYKTVRIPFSKEMKLPDEETAREWLKLSGVVAIEFTAEEMPLDLLVRLYPEATDIIYYGPNGINIAKFHAVITKTLTDTKDPKRWDMLEEVSKTLDLEIAPDLLQEIGFIKDNLNALGAIGPAQTFLMRYVFIRIFALLAFHGLPSLDAAVAKQYDELVFSCLRKLKLNPYSFLNGNI